MGSSLDGTLKYIETPKVPVCGREITARNCPSLSWRGLRSNQGLVHAEKKTLLLFETLGLWYPVKTIGD